MLQASFETMIGALQKMIVDVQQYIMKMQKERELSAMRIENVPQGVNSMSSAGVLGWECSICGLMNNEELRICEGCFHHRYD